MNNEGRSVGLPRVRKETLIVTAQEEVNMIREWANAEVRSIVNAAYAAGLCDDKDKWNELLSFTGRNFVETLWGRVTLEASSLVGMEKYTLGEIVGAASDPVPVIELPETEPEPEPEQEVVDLSKYNYSGKFRNYIIQPPKDELYTLDEVESMVFAELVQYTVALLDRYSIEEPGSDFDHAWLMRGLMTVHGKVRKDQLVLFLIEHGLVVDGDPAEDGLPKPKLVVSMLPYKAVRELRTFYKTNKDMAKALDCSEAPVAKWQNKGKDGKFVAPRGKNAEAVCRLYEEHKGVKLRLNSYNYSNKKKKKK